MSRRKTLYGLGAVVVLVAFLMVMPTFLKNAFYIQLFTTSAIMAIAVIGMDLLFGYVGYVSFGQAGFMAIGAYTPAFLVSKVGVSFPLAVLCGILLSGLMAYLISFATFRLTGIYFAIGTMAFGQLVWVACYNWTDVTGGVYGIVGLPNPFGGLTGYYYFAFLMLFVMLFLVRRLVKSPVGEAFVAVRENERLAESAGIATLKTKRFAFVLSAMIMGLAGAMFVFLWTFASSGSFTLSLSLEVLVINIIGGVGTLIGPAIAAFVLNFVMQYLATVPALRLIIYGVLLMLIVMFLPGGLAGTYLRAIAWVKARRQKGGRAGVSIDSTELE